MLSLMPITTVVRAEELPLRQPIYPLECFFEEISSGGEQPMYSITPEECFEDPLLVEEAVNQNPAANLSNRAQLLSRINTPSPNTSNRRSRGSEQSKGVYEQFAEIIGISAIQSSGVQVTALSAAIMAPVLFAIDRFAFSSRGFKSIAQFGISIGRLFR